MFEQNMLHTYRYNSCTIWYLMIIIISPWLKSPLLQYQCVLSGFNIHWSLPYFLMERRKFIEDWGFHSILAPPSGSLVALSVFEHMGSILLLCDILLKWIYDFRGYWRTMLNVIDVIIIPLTSPILMSTIKIISPPTAAGNYQQVRFA